MKRACWAFDRSLCSLILNLWIEGSRAYLQVAKSHSRLREATNPFAHRIKAETQYENAKA